MRYHCVALFSGGLDSILACKVIQKQGLNVLGLHFVSPFFGKPEKKDYWRELYGIDVLVVDIGEDFVKLLKNGPKWGLGKGLNPCVDCKILMLKKAKEFLPVIGAEFIITGEVLGQRPMSQRRDTINLIAKEAGVKGLVLRPLSAKLLNVTYPEEKGLVKREELLALKGRGRKPQLELAKEFGLKEIPTPSGGCLLTDLECVKRFWAVLTNLKDPKVEDFELAKVGRQFWINKNWLVIGRNKSDNKKLLSLLSSNDILFKVADIPGPIGLGRQKEGKWDKSLILEGAMLLVSFCKGLNEGESVKVKVGIEGRVEEIVVKYEEELKERVRWAAPSIEGFEENKKNFWKN